MYVCFNPPREGVALPGIKYVLILSPLLNELVINFKVTVVIILLCIPVQTVDFLVLLDGIFPSTLYCSSLLVLKLLAPFPHQWWGYYRLQ